MMQFGVGCGVSRRSVLSGIGGSLAAVALGSLARATASAKVPATAPRLLAGARIFDGQSAKLLQDWDVLVADERIEALVPRGQGPADAEIVDCSGKVIMPGLIDAHWHSLLAALPMPVAMTADIGYIHLLAAQEAERTVLRGFTSIRDAGGPAFALT
jgi:imidazolonepropionase-like amidohydrolase